MQCDHHHLFIQIEDEYLNRSKLRPPVEVGRIRIGKIAKMSVLWLGDPGRQIEFGMSYVDDVGPG